MLTPDPRITASLTGLDIVESHRGRDLDTMNAK